jgi:hypothetical protein
MKKLVIAILCITATIAAAAKEPPVADPWTVFGSLLGGTWTGEGGGEPGSGSGGFSFRLELQGKIIVRRNSATYPATKDSPAMTHEDLMVVYRESAASPLRADYYDSEGHVIRYVVSMSDDGKSAQFLSDPSPSVPRYRLTYTSAGADQVKIRFEIAPPDKPGVFATYIEAKASRKAAP